MKLDLHIHTNFSYDGLDSPEKIVNSAISKGLDCICITDHHEISGALEALRFAFSKPILVIPGIEIKSKHGDILGINIKKIIPDNLTAEQTIVEINKLGGMAIIPHPFAWPHNFKKDLKEIFKKLPDLSIGIEALNASILNSANKKSLNIVKELDVPFTAGSDAHGADFVGNAFLEIPGEDLSINEVIEKIKSKKGQLKGGKVSFSERLKWEYKRGIRKMKNKRLKV